MNFLEMIVYLNIFLKKKKKKNSKNFFWSFNTFAHENIDEDTVSDDDNEKQY